MDLCVETNVEGKLTEKPAEPLDTLLCYEGWGAAGVVSFPSWVLVVDFRCELFYEGVDFVIGAKYAAFTE